MTNMEIKEEFDKLQAKLEELSETESDLSEDLFRDVDVLSSEDEEGDEIGLFKESIFKNADGESINIGPKGERMSQLKTITTLLSR